MTKQALNPYVSSAAQQFAPGNFVTTWNPELGRNAVGVTLAVEDPQEANPRIKVKWAHDLGSDWVRAEYLNMATERAFRLEVARDLHSEISRAWIADAQKHEDAAREIRAYDDRDEIDEEELALNDAVAETLRGCIGDLLYPAKPSVPEEEITF